MTTLFSILKAYNFWDNPLPDTGFERESYTLRLQPFLGNRLIKVLVGQRRSGKSYIMRQLMRQLLKNGVSSRNIFYFNKELVEFEEIADFKQLHSLIKEYELEINPIGRKHIFLDEIQLVEGWEKLVNSLSQDYTTEYEVFITGSNSRLLSGELATLLSGRYVEFEILPYAFAEYCKFITKKQDKESLLQYLKTGGLPELFNLNGDEARANYINSLKDTIILRDIVQRYKIKDAVLLEKMFRYLVNNIGNLVSLSNIEGYLKTQKVKTNYETLSNYVGYLMSTFLIHETARYNLKGKELLAGARKYYLNDLAFRNYMSATSFEFGLGQLLENYVYLHYKSLGYTLHVGALYQKEIDFVIEKNKERKYIQVTYLLTDTAVIEREFGNLAAINDNHEKLVVSLDDVSFGNKDGIKHVRAWELPV